MMLPRFSSAALLALCVTGTRPHRSPVRLMFPQLVLVRGPALSHPVAFTHAGAVGMSIENDTLARLYDGLRLFRPHSAARVRGRVSFEVAEYFGDALSVYYAPDGTLARQPEWRRATQVSRVYVAGSGEPPLWESPMVAPGGATRGFYEIDSMTQRIFGDRGIRLQPSGAR